MLQQNWKKWVNDTREFVTWFSPHLLPGTKPREKNWLIMIKNVTNINRLTKKKDSLFYYSMAVFVMMSLIILRALEFPSMLGSIFLWCEFSFEFLNSLQTARPIFSQRCLVLFPKNPKILLHKKCLDDMSKLTRWLTHIL